MSVSVKPALPEPAQGKPDQRKPGGRGFRKWLWWLLLPALILLLASAWVSGLFGLGLQYLSMRRAAPEWQENGLWLPFYTATIEARPVEGVADNLSGLTFSHETGTLFAVINRPPKVVELSREGQILRIMPITGLKDPEGITHVQGPVFVISDEARQSLSWVLIDPETEEVDARGAPHISLGYDSFGNMGFEGVSWDSRRDTLYVAQEMWPVRVLMFSGLATAIQGEGVAIEISEWHPASLTGHFAADLSSISVHDATGQLLLLSDLTGALAEYTPEGEPISVMPLWKGWHGLTEDVPQAEGLAVDDEGDIYLVSEPNLFYRFSRSPAPRWAGQRAYEE